MKGGLIHYYFGHGKGKTTAALGLMARALGHGRKVMLIQFLKGRPCGEVAFYEGVPGVVILRGKPSMRMASGMNAEERAETRRMHDENLMRGLEAVRNGCCDLLILDEVSDALLLGLLDGDALLGFLHAKPDALEVVLTGHEPLPEFVEIADYVTEMKKHKHPYDQGITAREGVEI